MKAIDSVQDFLDKQRDIGIWYAKYDGEVEEVLFVNQHFSETFGLPIDEILHKKKYHLINPPDTSSKTIEQYKNEDHEAMEKGYFLNYSKTDAGEERVVLKVGFDQGVVGIFMTLNSPFDGIDYSLQDLNPELQKILRKLSD